MLVEVVCSVLSSKAVYQSFPFSLVKFWHYLNSFRVYVLIIVKETYKPTLFAYVMPLIYALIVLNKPRDILSIKPWNPLPKQI